MGGLEGNYPAGRGRIENLIGPGGRMERVLERLGKPSPVQKVIATGLRTGTPAQRGALPLRRPKPEEMPPTMQAEWDRLSDELEAHLMKLPAPGSPGAKAWEDKRDRLKGQMNALRSQIISDEAGGAPGLPLRKGPGGVGPPPPTEVDVILHLSRRDLEDYTDASLRKMQKSLEAARRRAESRVRAARIEEQWQTILRERRRRAGFRSGTLTAEGERYTQSGG
jgi:hypothetical protein